MHREAHESGNALPRDAKWPARPTKQPSFGGDPERPVGLRQDFIHNIARQPTCSRVTLPFPVPSPLDESPALQPNPQRVLPVLEGGVDRSAKADGSVDLLPAFLVSDQQSIG